MKNKRLIFLLLSGILCSACNTTWQWQANPIHSDYRSQIKSICIENNSKVKIDRFQETLINRIESYHIQTQVFNAPFKPNACEFTLNYDGLDLTKYQGNDVKINQVVDGLLNSGKK